MATTAPRHADTTDSAKGNGNTNSKSASNSNINRKRNPRMNEAEREAAMLATLQANLAELDPAAVADAIRKGKRGIPIAADFNLEQEEDFDIAVDDPRKVQAGFWAEGEPTLGVDEDYYGDDITSHGHGELQKQRDIREYARLIAWELPLLSRTSITSSISPPFNPTTNTPPPSQNSPVPSPRPPKPPPSASATPPTSANRTRPPTKWSSSSPPPTWASPRSSATS